MLYCPHTGYPPPPGSFESIGAVMQNSSKSAGPTAMLSVTRTLLLNGLPNA